MPFLEILLGFLGRYHAVFLGFEDNLQEFVYIANHIVPVQDTLLGPQVICILNQVLLGEVLDQEKKDRNQR